MSMRHGCLRGDCKVRIWDLLRITYTKIHECKTQPAYPLDTHLYTEFHFKMSICNGDNERKLKINGIFLSPRGITLPKVFDQTQTQTQPAYSPDTSIYQISIQNGDNERKLKLMEYFLSPRGTTLPKVIPPDQNSN